MENANLERRNNRIIRQKTALIKPIRPPGRKIVIVKSICRQTLRNFMLNKLSCMKKEKTSGSPDSTRFVRKKSKFNKVIRSISVVKPKNLPSPMSPKEIAREIMNRDERRLIDSLLVDQKRYQEEFQSNLGTIMLSALRSPRKKLLV